MQFSQPKFVRKDSGVGNDKRVYVLELWIDGI